VDPHYIDALGIPLLTGRFYSPEMALDHFPSAADHTGDSVLQTNLVINQRAVTALGLGTPAQAIGQVMEERNERDDGSVVKTHMTIIGVVGDAYLHSAKKPVRPEIYWYVSGYYHLLVRYSGTGPAALAEVRDVWEDFMPGEPFEYFFADQALAEEFQSEANQANIFMSFALLTMTIGCLGLYGLAAFVTECRRSEIGIRKILGARVRDIIALLFSQFSKLVIIANLVAWPLTYLLMKDWLAQYPLRIPDTWIIAFCILAGLLSSVVVAMTVSSQAWRVATSNPIRAIQHE
jgi:putative ABC transport system permease protein